MQTLANGAGVPLEYARQYANRVTGEPNTNALKNKANKDRAVANLLGKKNVTFIEPSRYNATLAAAKKQRFVANRKANGLSMAYLNTYMRATKANSVDDINTANFMNKFKMDKNLMEKEAVRAGPVTRFGQVKGMFRRATKGVEYVPKNTYNNRMKKALAEIENKAKYEASLKAGKNFKLVAKRTGGDMAYLQAYMQAKNLTQLNQVNYAALTNKVAKDKQLLANEAALSGKKRKLTYIANDDYNKRAKNVETAKKERLLVKNIPKNFLNAYRTKTGKSINNLSENNKELKNLYAKALKLSELSGEPVAYPENVAAVNKRIANLDKEKTILEKYTISKNFLKAHFNKTGTNINTVNENVLKTAVNKAKELSSFLKLKTPLKYPDEKINENLTLARAQKQENANTKRSLAIIKQNIKYTNIEKFMKNKGTTAQQLLQNQNTMKMLVSEDVKKELSLKKVPANVIKEYQGDRNHLAREDVKKVLNYYNQYKINQKQKQGMAKKLQKTQAALTKRAKKAGLLELNVTTNLNAAEQKVKKAEQIQNAAKKTGVDVNSYFVKNAINFNNEQLTEALLTRKLKSMGVNNAWIAAYKSDNQRKQYLTPSGKLQNSVIATAQRQLNMTKNAKRTELKYMNQEEKMTTMNTLYLKTTAKEFANRYGISETQAKNGIREAMGNYNTYKLRDSKYKRKIEAKVAEKYKNVRDFKKAKEDAKKTIERMSIAFKPGGKLNQTVVNKFLKNLEAANNKTKVNAVLKEAQEAYKTPKTTRRTIPVQEVNSNSNSNNNRGNNSRAVVPVQGRGNSTAVVPYGPRNSTAGRQIRNRVGQVVGRVGQAVGSVAGQVGQAVGSVAGRVRGALPASTQPALPASTQAALPAPTPTQRANNRRNSAPQSKVTNTNRGVHWKIFNSTKYNTLTPEERKAFFQRWMNKKDKSIWGEMQRIQKSRTAKSGNKRIPELTNKSRKKTKKEETNTEMTGQGVARLLGGVFGKKQPKTALTRSGTRKNVKEAARARKKQTVKFKVGGRTQVKPKLRSTQGALPVTQERATTTTKVQNEAKRREKLNEQARLEEAKLRRKPTLRTSTR